MTFAKEEQKSKYESANNFNYGFNDTKNSFECLAVEEPPAAKLDLH